MSLRDLVLEIHHRSIWQVLGVYVLSAVAALEVVEFLVENTALPGWFPTFSIALAILGLPIVLASAVVHEEEPERRGRQQESARTKASEIAEAQGEFSSPTSSRRPVLWQRALGAVVLLFAIWGVVAAGWVLGSGSGVLATVRQAPATAPGAAGSAETAVAVGRLAIATDPPGALVKIVPVHPVAELPGRDLREVGETPVRAEEVPAAEYLVSLEASGMAPLRVLATVHPGEVTNVMQSLTPAADASGMLRVEAGSHTAGEDPGTVSAFLMDRHEVTNSEYLEFIAAGGYEDRSLWPEIMLVAGDSLPGAEALRAFVDQTGAPGPEGWSGGLYPKGTGSHPVVGVSWYEARAYAAWAGRALPTWDQWWRAAVGEDGRIFPWGSDVEAIEARANFENEGSEPVGSRPIGVSPFGIGELAGNVREWLREPAGGEPGRRLAVGGSWSEPSYSFEPSHTVAFPPAFRSPSVGFRTVKPRPSNLP